MEWIVNKEDELEAIALELLEKYPAQRLFTISGNMGSGKTTFIKYLCKTLGIVDQVSSPTFSLINEYESKDLLKVYHFDFYRIRNLDEAYDIGYEEYFYSGNYCFIEWPEAIQELVPRNALGLKIELKNGIRQIIL